MVHASTGNIGGLTNSDRLLEQIRLKAIPQDFCVTEILALPPAYQNSRAGFRYYRLKKSGFTTFEAIRTVAEFYSIEQSDISYCGLKDEDGITDQMIAMPSSVGPIDTVHFNNTYGNPDNYISLIEYGFYASPLSIGGLEGNAFRLVVRGLPRELADQLPSSGKTIHTTIINYYDTQRFGTPGSPKTTHLIGESLLKSDYGTALELLRKAGTPESGQAASYSGNAQAFFDQLDRRVTAFYMSASSSYHWNEAVMTALRQSFHASSLLEYQRHGIDYLIPKNPAQIANGLGIMPSYEYRRYTFRNGAYTYAKIERPTFFCVTLRLDSVRDDERNPECKQACLCFTLPSGTYATNVVTQLMLGLSASQFNGPG